MVAACAAVCLCVAPAAAGQQRPPLDPLADAQVVGAPPTLKRLMKAEHGLAWAMRYRRPKKAGHRDRIERVLRQLFEARLGRFTGFRSIVEVPAPMGARREDLRDGARASNADLLLSLDVYEKRNHLHVVGELFEVRLSFWSRIRRPVTGMRSHYYATTRIDAEVRGLMDLDSSRGPRKFDVRRAPAALDPPGGVLAAAVADVDGDRLNEVILLDDDALRVVRLLPRRTQPLAKWPLKDLPHSEQRSRDRYGAVQAADLDGDGRAEIALWTSDLERGHVLRFERGRLVAVRAPAALTVCGRPRPAGAPLQTCGPPLAVMPALGASRDPPTLLVGRSAEGRNHLTDRVSPWSLAGESGYHPHPGLHWHLSGLALKHKARGVYTDLMATVDKKGTVRVRGGGATWTGKSVGVACVMSDLNDDGEAELFVTRASLPSEPDRLTALRLAPNGKTHKLWSKTFDPIASLAAGDADNDGFLDLVVATTGGTYLVRELR